jgi:hypothetical protein
MLNKTCDKGEHSMEYWPCLIDIVYFSAKIITKLIANHSLSIYCNSHTQTCWTIAHSGVIFWHQHTPCCLSAARICGRLIITCNCICKKIFTVWLQNGTSFCTHIDGYLCISDITSAGDCWCNTCHFIFP